MSTGMQAELQTFLISAFWGMLVIVYYDFFRIIRVIIPHKTWMVAVEDFVFCIGTGCIILGVSYCYLQGQIRGYLFLGMAVGAGLWYMGISPIYRKIIVFFYDKWKEVLKKVKKESTIKSNEKERKSSHE